MHSLFNFAVQMFLSCGVSSCRHHVCKRAVRGASLLVFVPVLSLSLVVARRNNIFLHEISSHFTHRTNRLHFHQSRDSWKKNQITKALGCSLVEYEAS